MKIKNLTSEGKGVTKNHNEKTIFVQNALWNEEVIEYETIIHKKNYDEVIATQLNPLKISPFRVTPACPDFYRCGGCSLQHIDIQAQTFLKQRGLEENIRYLGKVIEPYQRLSPIMGMEKHYRHRARVHFFQTATEIQIGFQPKGFQPKGFQSKVQQSFVTPNHCIVLQEKLQQYIVFIHQSLNKNNEINSLLDQKPEVKKGLKGSIHLSWDSYHQKIGVFYDFHPNTQQTRALEKIKHKIIEASRIFEKKHLVLVQLRFEKKLLAGISVKSTKETKATSMLAYEQRDEHLLLEYDVLDFTQVNPISNQTLIHQALKLLNLQPQDKVIDFFCGLGNFTLPIAKRASFVHGIEGVMTQVEKAHTNAKNNQLEHKTSFSMSDLFTWKPQDVMNIQKKFQANKWLLDPPRDGAFELIKALADVSLIASNLLPHTLVYVSCDHATLSRDIRVLSKHGGYKLISAGILNIFPHTSHVESIVLLMR